MSKRKTPPRERPELSRLETEIMDVVWRLGECSSAEVIAAYSKVRRLAPTTIRTVLSNLRKKGYVEPVATIEPGVRFRPAVERESVIRRTLKSLVASLLGGSPRQAIAYLLKEETLSDTDVEELRRLIDSQKSNSQKKGKRP
jgi:BlaI family transcriptional regulator, penicillinase repressor